MQEQSNENNNRETETSQRKFINVLLNPLKEYLPGITTSSQLILKDRNNAEPSETHSTENRDQDRTLKVLKRGIHDNQETIASLLATVEEKQATEDEMVKRFNKISKMTETFTKYYNNLCDNFKSIESDRDVLSKMFENVILLQQSKIQQLGESVTREQMIVAEQKMLVAEKESESLAQETRINELLEYVKEINENISQEKNDVKRAFEAEKCKLLQERAEMKLETDKLYETLREMQAEKTNVAESLKQMDKLEKELCDYRAQAQQLFIENKEYNSLNENLLREKEELQEQLNNHANSQGEKISALVVENGKLLNDLSVWKNRYKEAENVYRQFEQRANDLNGKYAELMQRYAELELSAEKKEDSNRSVIRDLRKKVEILQKEQHEGLSKQNVEVRRLKETLEENYKQERSALTNEVEWNKKKLCEMEKRASENEKYHATTNSKLLEMEKENNSLREKIRKLEIDNRTLQSVVNINSYEEILRNSAIQPVEMKEDKRPTELKKNIQRDENLQMKEPHLTNKNMDKPRIVAKVATNLQLPVTAQKMSTTTEKKSEKDMHNNLFSSKSKETLEKNIYDFVLSSDESEFERQKVTNDENPGNRTYSTGKLATKQPVLSQTHSEMIGKGETQSAFLSSQTFSALSQKKQSAENKKEKFFFTSGKTDVKDSGKKGRKRKW